MAEVRGSAAVLSCVDAERDALRGELRILDGIAGQLRLAMKEAKGEVAGRPEPAGGPVESRTRRTQAKRGAISRTPEAAARRRREFHRFLVEHGESTPGEIRTAFPGTRAKTLRAAMKRLEGEGKVRRKGEPKRPTYEAVDTTGEPAPTEGTKSGLLLSFIQENDGAPSAQLMAITGMTEDEVRTECGMLIRDGEIRFERRGDDFFYVPQAGA